MCGISGIINNQGIDLLSIVKMNNLIRHRGPDDEGYFLEDSNHQIYIAGGCDTSGEVWSYKSPYQPIINISEIDKRNLRIALGHRRLSILDLSAAGHQPMSFANGRYWIVFNGEIYNYIEIRKELIYLGYIFVSDSDTEVVLAAWHEWGIECQDRFNGMWALVIYDRMKEEIFITRDRFGIKPLYYWFTSDGSFCFASEIKQFSVCASWDAKVNPQRVYDYLVYSFTDHTEETMFYGVYQIPGGHYFRSGLNDIMPDSQGKIRLIKWYDLVPNQYKGTFEQASQKFEEIFKSSIDLHLRADVSVGSALSGGLDSSAIVCEVNNILRKQGVEHLQKTFSSCSTDERFSEKKWMDVVVENTKVDAYFVFPALKDVFRLTPELIWYHDEPYKSQSAFLGYHVFELAKINNVKVLINGQGADEYLGGYGQFTGARFRKLFVQLNWRKLINEIHNSGNISKYTCSFALRTILLSMLPGSVRSFLVDHFGKIGRIKKIIDHNKLGSKEINPNVFIPVSRETVQGISKHLTFYSTLPKFLKWEDRNSMANSIEARIPFLDYRLVEFAYNLPDNYLDFQGETKRILRQGLKNILPEKIKNRKDKKGFITPEELWVKEDNPALFRSKIEKAIEITKGIIKPDALNYFDKMVVGKIPFDNAYWRLILFAEWIKRFDVKLK